MKKLLAAIAVTALASVANAQSSEVQWTVNGAWCPVRGVPHAHGSIPGNTHWEFYKQLYVSDIPDTKIEDCIYVDDKGLHTIDKDAQTIVRRCEFIDKKIMGPNLYEATANCSEKGTRWTSVDTYQLLDDDKLLVVNVRSTPHYGP